MLIATKRHGDPFNKEPSSLRQKGSADMFPIKDNTILIFLSFTKKEKEKEKRLRIKLKCYLIESTRDIG